MKRMIFFILVPFLFSAAMSPGNAAVFNVTNYTELWNALASAGNNGEDDVINLAAGTYPITWPLTYFASANPGENSQLTIQGAGAGVTVLDGGGAYKILSITTNHNGLAVDDRSHVTIRNLTFSHGHDSYGPDFDGGALAVYAEYANITLENCVFTDNYSAQAGGGAYLSTSYGTVALSNCVFMDNSATQEGGGAHLTSIYGTLTATDVTFSQNSIENPNGSVGGGLYMEGRTLSLVNNTFQNNEGGYYGLGGGAFLWARNVSFSVISLTNNSFTGNSTGGIGSGLGGGVYIRNEGIETTLTNNTFAGNTASGGWGGGLNLHFDENCSTLLTGNKVLNNSAFYGGGLWIDGGYYSTLTATNNIIKSNDAVERGGGGVIELSPDNELILINNTIVENQAVNSYQVPTEGGGLYIQMRSGTANIYNNIVWGNISLSGGDLYTDDYGTSALNLLFNDFSDFYSYCRHHACEEDPTINAGNNIDSNPRLTPDFHLLPSSPCINAGSNNAPNLPLLDFEGDSRVGGGIVDMGADESPLSEPRAYSPPDFDGDGRADFAIYRRSWGAWYIRPSGGEPTYGLGWGGDQTDIPVPGDYDGDGKTDVAIYRSDNGAWWIIPSSTGTPYGVGHGGGPTDIPVPGDYDGDGKTDIAIYREAWGAWYLIPSGGGSTIAMGWGGGATDIPVPADYDGDGKTDVAIYRAENGAWWIIPSSTGIPYGVGHGGGITDIPVPGDYDGDGKTDIAIYRQAWGAWYIQPSGGGAVIASAWGGGPSDIPVPADYDGDGKADVAIYRAETGAWWIIPSSTGISYGVGFGGGATDIPITPGISLTP